ncbi:MAG: hypothetical protein Q8R78_01795 [Candidatus Omnitrophota bacterium]|nr:hypothetical protein [Candidatus Omnitrophota bacterium]
MEVVLGGMALSVAIAAILGAYIGQLTLNEHARNLSVAIQDANRVIERIRQQNTSAAGCTTAPSALPPGGFATWDVWLDDTSPTGGGGKSIYPDPNPAVNEPHELVVLTSQNRDGSPLLAGANPIRVTAAVCWRHRNRTLGECTWSGTSLSANPGAGGDPLATESPAMLTTLVTCR